MDHHNPVKEARTGETFFFTGKANGKAPEELRKIHEAKFPNCCDKARGEITGESTVRGLSHFCREYR